MAEYYPNPGDHSEEPEEPEDVWEQVPPEPDPGEPLEEPAETPAEASTEGFPEQFAEGTQETPTEAALEPFTEASTEPAAEDFTAPEPEVQGAARTYPVEEPSQEQRPAETPPAGPSTSGPVPPAGPAYAPALSISDERTWAMLAHLSVLLNVVTGFLGPIAALLIYLIYKDRSRYVGYHAMQSFVFQMLWWVGGVALITLTWIVVGGLSALVVGLLCIPFAILGTIALALLPLGALVYGVIGAIQVSQGRDFRYWLVGDWVRGTLSGF